MSREKKSKLDIWRGYGLGESINGSKPPGNRYKSNTRKSIYWWLVSRYCRIRDWRKYKTCISCGREMFHWKDGDGGHYAPAGSCGIGLLFDLFNVNLECSKCNAFDPMHLVGYRKGLIERHGVAVVDDLEARYKYAQQNPGFEKEWTQDMYDTRIKDLITLMVEEDILVKMD